MPRLVDALKFQRNSPPRIVGSVTTRAGLVRAAKASGNDCDLIEVRLDLMPKPLLTDLTALNRLLAAVPLPILATLRSTREGGQCSWPLGWRLEFFSKLLPQIALIDLELFAAANCADAIQRFAAAGKKIVLSCHDFDKLPADRFVRKKIASMHGYGAHVAKFAAHLKSHADIDRLENLMDGWDKPVALMGMGPWATESRLRLALAGSALNYGYYDAPAAPGQIHSAELKALLSRPEALRS